MENSSCVSYYGCNFDSNNRNNNEPAASSFFYIDIDNKQFFPYPICKIHIMAKNRIGNFIGWYNCLFAFKHCRNNTVLC